MGTHTALLRHLSLANGLERKCKKYNAFYVSVDDTPRCVGVVDKNEKAGSQMLKSQV